MAIIERTWTFFPGRSYTQEECAEVLPRWLSGRALGLAQQLFRRSGVKTRHFAYALDEMLRPGRSFAQKNEVYRVEVRDTVAALSRCICEGTTEEERASVELLVTASCTGFQIPAIDAALVPLLELSPNVRRLNLTEHGCAAGAASLGMAHEWLKSRPEARALVVCAELCSTAFLPEDHAEENLVSAAIFGDGAAAVLLAGDGVERLAKAPPGLRLRDTFREIFAGTEHFMGYEVRDEGFKIKLARDVVSFSASALPDLFSRVFRTWGIDGPEALSFGAVHPGGRRVLEALEDYVRLPPAVTRTSWETLESYGNMSSVTVLAALHRLMQRGAPLGSLGLLSAFGPGFCAELALLEGLGMNTSP